MLTIVPNHLISLGKADPWWCQRFLHPDCWCLDQSCNRSLPGCVLPFPEWRLEDEELHPWYHASWGEAYWCQYSDMDGRGANKVWHLACQNKSSSTWQWFQYGGSNATAWRKTWMGLYPLCWTHTPAHSQYCSQRHHHKQSTRCC